MRKIIFGILISMLMITSALVNASFIGSNIISKDESKLFEIKDGKITTTINVGDYKIEKTKKEMKSLLKTLVIYLFLVNQIYHQRYFR